MLVPSMFVRYSFQHYEIIWQEATMQYCIKEMGLRIKELRKKAGMTQEQFAECLNIAIATIGRIERGQQGISVDLLADLALYLGTSMDYIVFGYELQHDEVKMYTHVTGDMKKLRQAESAK